MLKENHIILAIEDELSIRRFLKTSIIRQGYQFLEAKNGKEGLEIMRDNKPDVLLKATFININYFTSTENEKDFIMTERNEIKGKTKNSLFRALVYLHSCTNIHLSFSSRGAMK